MNDQFESKKINISVVKLRNIGRHYGAWRPATAITCVSRLGRPRLDLNYFESQLGSLSFNQRLPNY